MSQLDIEKARFNMVEQQVRPWEVLDQRVLDLMLQVPREAFVPQAYRNLAFADINIPLANGQVMMSPKVEGRLLQALSLQLRDRVLEIGTGSGYLTALLAKSTKRVYSVDVFEDLIKDAEARLKHLNINNVSLSSGDAISGWKNETHYDVIVLGGSVPLLDPIFQKQLHVGGRLFAVVGEEPIMQALLITRVSEREWETDVLFETILPPLIGAPEPDRFFF
jgi:protein-L-isoaspartate(D-aspartate) O-methyltransferase